MNPDSVFCRPHGSVPSVGLLFHTDVTSVGSKEPTQLKKLGKSNFWLSFLNIERIL